MDTFQQPKITGYRQLSEAEVALMNEGKALAEACGAYIARLRAYVPTGDEPSDHVPGDTLDQPRRDRPAARIHGGHPRHRAADDVLGAARRTNIGSTVAWLRAAYSSARVRSGPMRTS